VSDRVQIALEVDPQAKEVLKEQDGYMWENLQRAVFETYGGDLETPSAIAAEIEQAKRERRNAIERKQEAEKEVQRQNQRIESLQERLEELRDEEGTVEEALDEVLDDMSELDLRVWPDHGKVNRLAREHFNGATGHEVIEALKERADERDLELSDDQFEEPYGGI